MLIRTLVTETQFDVIKKNGRNWRKGRGGAEFKEINATGAHTHFLTSALGLFCNKVGTWSPAVLGWASLEQYHQIKGSSSNAIQKS